MRTKNQWWLVLIQGVIMSAYLVSIKIGVSIHELLPKTPQWFLGMSGALIFVAILFAFMPRSPESMWGLAMRPVFSAVAIVLICAGANPLRPDINHWEEGDWVLWVAFIVIYTVMVPGISRRSIREYADFHGVSAGDVTFKVFASFFGLIVVSMGMLFVRGS